MSTFFVLENLVNVEDFEGRPMRRWVLMLVHVVS